MKWYYLLTSLPSLKPQFSAQPPLSMVAFWGKICQTGADSLIELIQTILLEKDMLALEQVYNNRPSRPSITIPMEALSRFPKELSIQYLYLPSDLAKSLGDKWKPELWKEYFSYAFSIARKYSDTLREWLEWELGLKYAMYDVRSQKKLRDSFWMETASLTSHSTDEYKKLSEDYRRASNPLDAEQILDKARWEKASSLCVPYSFGTDEVVVYTIQLGLLERWWNVSQNKENIFNKLQEG